ncbi:MAG: tripartite tricarboxylate transporter substrate binding protein [Hyphomicrobiales bacterium]|nr:tripartite tricarboxylate transporter substrate binding protein [Hyphomicrobiales bacterium]
MKRVWAAALACAGILAGPGALPARADFPDRPLKIVVPFPPGGGVDLIARVVGAGFTAELGQPVVIENKAGGGTIIGTDAVAKSAPDGYTLVLASFAHSLNPSLQPSLPYDTGKDFAPVGLIGRSFNVLVVSPKSRLKTVRDIIAAEKAKPGSLTYASQGLGTSAHLAGELFKNLAGVQMVHVPYRGVAQALTDIIGGDVDMIFGTSAAVTALVAGGEFHAVATTAPAGASPLPNVPTIADSGVPGYAVESWYGVYAPAGVPAAAIGKLNAALNKIITSAAFQKRVESEGLVTAPGAPEDLDRYVRAEEARWRKIVIENNIKLR